MTAPSSPFEPAPANGVSAPDPKRAERRPIIFRAARELGEGRYRYVVAAGCVVVAAVARLALFSDAPFVTFYTAVLVAALYGGMRSGFLATGLSVVAIQCMWVAMPESGGAPPGNWVALAIFAGTGAGFSVITGAMNRARAAAQEAAAETRLAAERARSAEAMERKNLEDMAERRRVSEQLRASEERFELAVRGSGAGLWDWDICTGKVYYSPRWKEIFGYREEEIGETFEDWARLLHPQERERICSFQADFLAGSGQTVTAEYQLRHKDGSYRWIEARGVVVRDAQGKACRLVGSHGDVTARHEAEEALRKSERLYRAIGETIDYGVWVCEPDGRNIYASPSFLKLVGQTQAECSDFGWGNVLHPEDAQRTIAAWKECVRTGGEWDIEHRYRGVDGKWHPILARGVPVRDEGGKIVCWAGINLDISRLKAAEDALEQARAQLQAHSEHLEKVVASRTAKLHETIAELEHYSYALAHDMRAPLRAMQGFADLIEEECTACGMSSRDYLRRIKIASARMDQLITDSLNYSKAARQEYTLEPVDLFVLLDGLVQTYPNLIPGKADILLELPLPVVLGNEAALTQCFSNLLGNAVKFARDGVKPRIRVWAQESGAAGGNGKKVVRVWVEDNGIGIPADAHERIFGMFERVATNREGTGIGLAIVRKVVERIGGKVGVESSEGQGSRFWVDLTKV